MHELSFAQSVLDIVEEEQLRDGFAKVDRIKLQIGKLSCLQPESLEWYLYQIAPSTILDNAKIDIDHINGHARCRDCEHHFEVDEIYHCCPKCLSFSTEILDGKETKIIELVVS